MAKILHLTNTYIPEDSRILKAIDTGKSHHNTVYGIGLFLPEKQHELNQDTLQDVQSVRLISKKFTKAPRLLAKLCEVIEMLVIFTLKGLRHRPDIIHCHDIPALPAAIIIKYLVSAKLVYDAHELSSQRNGLSKIDQKLIYLFEKISWPTINALIVVSPSIQKWYDANHKPKLSTVVLNSPHIATSALHSPSDTYIPKAYFHDKYRINKGRKIFIYLGYLCKGRGLEIMVDAFSRHEIASDLIIIGYGPLKDQLEASSKSSTNIHFHDAVKHEDVVPLARAADFGICMIEPISLSDEYCLPNKLFEYAFSGLPVIGSNLPDIQRLISEYNLGTCIDTHADNLEKLVKSIQQGTVNVSAQSLDITALSYQAQSKFIIEIYENLIAQ